MSEVAPEITADPTIIDVMADPASVFTDVPRWQAFFKALEITAKRAGSDVTTQRGRDNIASHAYQVARAKTVIDAAGKRLTDEWRTKTNAVNAKRRLVWDKLENLQHATRAPLDEWDAEKARIEAEAESILLKLYTSAQVGINDTAEQVALRLTWVRGINDLSVERFGDKTDVARAAHAAAITALVDAHQRILAAETLQAELVALREQAARADRARDSADRALAAEQMAAANKLAIAQAEHEAEQRGLERANREQAERLAREEQDRRAVTMAAEAEARRKSEDTVHRAAVNTAALEALIEHAGLEKRQAKAVVTSIAKGLIPAVWLKY